ncbi:Uma2 family endonuclease [Actinoplanes sp. M2I2]|uniref:Uma2 family endonuclease n=1 Tax=Actinoplanes sp. M2I2 TaxID=1734444 RepID=UPI00202013B2|nr:Uma2 family endonuclease [Actinoplanes sp. M2I2]
MNGMSAEAIGRNFPAVVTLDDLAAMNEADQYGHRYELSPEGVLSVMPPPGTDHAVVASRLLLWLGMAGWPAEQVLQAVGIRIPGRDGDGGRIPDLTVWARPLPPTVWPGLAELLLVVEIVSPGSTTMDQIIKLREYAAAGIPRYWVVDRDPAQTVTQYVLTAHGAYETVAKTPLASLLQSEPAEHQLGA